MKRKPSRQATLWRLPAFEGIKHRESITDLANPMPLEPLLIDEPHACHDFHRQQQSASGKDGTYLTSRDLRDRLQKELLTNVSIRVEDTDTPESFRVLGRGELQLAILIETMRREGFELMVGNPRSSPARKTARNSSRWSGW